MKCTCQAVRTTAPKQTIATPMLSDKYLGQSVLLRTICSTREGVPGRSAFLKPHSGLRRCQQFKPLQEGALQQDCAIPPHSIHGSLPPSSWMILEPPTAVRITPASLPPELERCTDLFTLGTFRR